MPVKDTSGIDYRRVIMTTGKRDMATIKRAQKIAESHEIEGHKGHHYQTAIKEHDGDITLYYSNGYFESVKLRNTSTLRWVFENV